MSWEQGALVWSSLRVCREMLMLAASAAAAEDEEDAIWGQPQTGHPARAADTKSHFVLCSLCLI